jgi:hypothetical protein
MLNPLLNNLTSFKVLDYSEFAFYIDNNFSNCNILSEKFLDFYFSNEISIEEKKIELS